MKFSLAINMERVTPDIDMREVARHTLQMVQMADAAGFEIVWAAEHHAIEMTIAPGPFQLLSWWGAHTNRIRLGTAVAVAPYWHPIKLAGEAGMLDLLTGGRLELGIGCGAYQREFDRMHPGLMAQAAVPYLQEMLPLLKKLWQGDCEHHGAFWSFPSSTACPKPVQRPHPPVWVAARNPVSFEWAITNGCNLMTWALSRPFEEVVTYKERFDAALGKAPAGAPRPRFLTMRTCAVYAREDEWAPYVTAVQRHGAQFESLFRGLGGVANGFPKEMDLATLQHRAEYDPAVLRENLMFGTPDAVVAKLRRYEALGVDDFLYCASYGLPMALQEASLKLFIEEVLPAFKDSGAEPRGCGR